MSLLDRIRECEQIFAGWKVLNSLEQLEELKQSSFHKPVVIFKHSTRCGISAHAKYRLENDWGFSDADMDFYYLDLIAHRPVSNKITEAFQVVHQSPQIILLRNGQSVFDTSHHMISVPVLRQALESVG